MLKPPPLTLFALILLAALVSVTSLLLLRGGVLSNEARIDAMPPEEALALLDTMQEPVSLELTFRHARLAAEAGRTQDAEAILSRLADSAATRGARAALAERQGDTDRAIALLTDAGAPALDPSRARTVSRLARLKGDLAREAAALSSIPAAAQQPQEALRLADLLAARSAWAELVQFTQDRIGAREEDRVEMLRRLAIVCVTQEKPAPLIDTIAALRLAPSFEDDLTAIAPILSQRSAVATEVADTLVARYPVLRPAMARALARGGAFSTARRLALDLVPDLPSPDAWSALSVYANASGDLPPLEQALQRIDGPPAEAYLPLVRHRSSAALLPYGQGLTHMNLETTPLLRAAWALAQGRLNEAATVLQIAAATGAAGEREAAQLWRSVYAELDRDPEAIRLVEGINSDPATAWLVME